MDKEQVRELIQNGLKNKIEPAVKKVTEIIADIYCNGVEDGLKIQLDKPENPNIWHNPYEEMPEDDELDVLFLTKFDKDTLDQKWLLGKVASIIVYGRTKIETHDGIYGPEFIEKWCYLKDLLALTN